MCGICGFNWKDNDLIKRMASEMIHRGPDQDAYYTADGVSFGHRRLSIIDLSEAGRQPMSNEDGSIKLIANGEIYNFQELRDNLRSLGHRFSSNSDSEVIIHAYEQYGEDFITRLRGMFAFAIWDEKKKSIFFARDRIGIKPFYYYFKDGKFVFASEIKSILQAPTVSRTLDRQALYDYMGFEFVPAPRTMFENIFKLPAGWCGTVQNGELKTRQYWELSFKEDSSISSYQDAVEKMREHLDFAVKSHLVSDVPLGVFLSGGLDSSSIVAMMRRHISGPLRTFTIGYQDKTFSELEYAKQVADHFSTEHHVLMIDDIRPEYVEKVLWHLDEPMTDLSTVPLYLVCKQAREYITVCLSGEGGDESIAGYDRFKASRLNRIYNIVPKPLRNLFAKTMEAIPDQPQKKGAINMLKRFVEGSQLPPDGEHLRWQYFSNRKQSDLLFKKAFKDDVNMDPFYLVRQYMAKCDTNDIVNRELFLDMRYMMTDSVLMKVDKMSMASSMEVRVPLLDHVFVEFIASLPGNWKLKGFKTKQIFRSALEGILPHNIVYRGKQGYSLPVKHLLRGQLKQYMSDLLNGSEIIKENIDIDHVNTMIAEHSSMKHNHNHVLWALINVAIWGNRFLKNQQ